MKQYIESNRNAYDLLAEEYPLRADKCSEAQKRLILSLKELLAERPIEEPYEVLELGPGAGSALQEMTTQGFETAALEFSIPMAQLAQSAAPEAKIIIDEFMDHDFGQQRFDAVYLVAFLHLFKSKDTPFVLGKIRNILRPHGLAVISTSKHESSSESIEPKDGFEVTALRYRRKFTKEALDTHLAMSGFNTLRYTENDGHGKRWMNYIVEKSLPIAVDT